MQKKTSTYTQTLTHQTSNNLKKNWAFGRAAHWPLATVLGGLDKILRDKIVFKF